MLNEGVQPQWFAAYTRSHHEMTAAQHFASRRIEYFAPTYESVRIWKDRRKRLALPLFPGYVFVRVALDRRLSVLMVPGVVRLVGFNQPMPLPDAEIEMLQIVLSSRLAAEPHPYLTVGRKVQITRGALQGFQGILVRKKGRVRLLLSIDLIRRSALIELDIADVEPV